MFLTKKCSTSVLMYKKMLNKLHYISIRYFHSNLGECFFWCVLECLDGSHLLTLFQLSFRCSFLCPFSAPYEKQRLERQFLPSLKQIYSSAVLNILYHLFLVYSWRRASKLLVGLCVWCFFLSFWFVWGCFVDLF